MKNEIQKDKSPHSQHQSPNRHVESKIYVEISRKF